MKTPLPELRSFKNTRRTSAATLVELVIASAVLTLALTSSYLVFGRAVNLVKATNYTTIALTNSNARLDQLRNMKWVDVSNPVKIETLLSTRLTVGDASVSTKNLDAILPVTTETIACYKYKTNVGSTTQTLQPVTSTNAEFLFSVTRSGTGAPTKSKPAAMTTYSGGVSPTDVALNAYAQNELNFVVTTEWQATGRRAPNMRQVSTVLCKTAARY